VRARRQHAKFVKTENPNIAVAALAASAPARTKTRGGRRADVTLVRGVQRWASAAAVATASIEQGAGYTTRALPPTLPCGFR